MRTGFFRLKRVLLPSLLLTVFLCGASYLQAKPVWDVDIDPNGVNPAALETLIEKFENIKKSHKGKIPIGELFQIIGLRQDQADQLTEASKTEYLEAQCYSNDNLEHLFCEFTGELNEPVKIVMDQVDMLIGSPSISFGTEIRMRARLISESNKERNGLDFCLIEGVSGSFGVSGKLHGALVELVEDQQGNKSASGFFDLGAYGTYSKKQNHCTEEGIASDEISYLESQGYTPTRGCKPTMVFTDYDEWERKYFYCPGALLCLNTKATNWCENSDGLRASTPRIQFECVLGNGGLQEELSRSEKRVLRSDLREKLSEKAGVSSCCNSKENVMEQNMFSATSIELPDACRLP
jgi:hypothetical protein